MKEAQNLDRVQPKPEKWRLNRRGPRPFVLVFAALCIVNAAILGICAAKGGCWLAALPFNWPSILVLPDEADELLGIKRVALISWFVALPWLAVVSAFIVRAFDPLQATHPAIEEPRK